MLAAPASFAPFAATARGAALIAPAPAELLDPLAALAQLQQVCDENETLREELGRCYKYLSAVFQITDKISPLRRPAAIEQAVLRCYAEMLRADHLLIADAAQPQPRPLALADPPGHTAAPPEITAPVSELAAQALRRPRSVRTKMDSAAAAGGAGWSVLLAGFRDLSNQPTALLALRGARQASFDIGDELVSETVLAYGGHILQNAIMVQRMQQSAFETVCAFANAVDARDPYTRGHCERVGWLARRTGTALHLSGDELDALEWSGILHDVGKIGVSEAVLNKPGALTPAEFAEIQKHPRLGHDMLRPISMLEPVLPGVLHHHENYDGSGYPLGLAGERIPLIARILRVVDTFDALISTRSYRESRTAAQALEVLAAEAGTAFDTDIVRTFSGMLRRWLAQGDAEFEQRFGALSRVAPPQRPAGRPDHAPPRGEPVDAAALAGSQNSET